MPQLSLYIDDVMMSRMKSSAAAEGLSLSRYAADAIRVRLEAPVRKAADGYWDRLYGCLADDDTFVRPEQWETHSIQPLDLA